MLFNPNNNPEIAMMSALMESTCQKRKVICILLDKDEKIVAIESNHCNPPNGVCAQLNMVTAKETYPPNRCNSEHAEVRALKLAKRMPKYAVLIGHKFLCDDCERLLTSYGIELTVLGEIV